MAVRMPPRGHVASCGWVGMACHGMAHESDLGMRVCVCLCVWWVVVVVAWVVVGGACLRMLARKPRAKAFC